MDDTVVTTLPSGRVFEKWIFGVTDESQEPIIFPPVLDFDSSMQEVIVSNWSGFARSCELKEEYTYNPAKPELGKTKELWLAVRKHLPHRMKGHGGIPLQLYVAVGRCSLDFYHGVDAFFWWQGVYVTLDASLIPKVKGARDKKLLLKADFVISPQWMTEDGLAYTGCEIARILKERRIRLLIEQGEPRSKKPIKKKFYEFNPDET